jgi:mannitol-specific phosphotransferase system IIBC component
MVVKMNQTTATIVAVVISSGVSLLISILTIINQNKKQATEMDKKIAVIETKMDIMQGDIRSHNEYAKMFSENIPAIKTHMEDVDRRLDRIEGRMAS